MKNNWKANYLRYKSFYLNILKAYQTKPNLKIYLEIILSLITVAIFSVFAIKPTITTIIELNNEIKAKQGMIDQMNRKITNLKTASNLLQSENQSLLLIEQAIPKTSNSEVLLSQIESLANQYQLNILNISMSDVAVSGEPVKPIKKDEILPSNAKPVDFSVSVSGDYLNLYNFLNAMEQLRRPVKIDGLSITTSTTETGKNIVMIVSAKVPFY